MPKITNAGKTPRAFHLASRNDYCELASGASVDVTNEDLDALGKSAAFAACVAPDALVIEGVEPKAAKKPSKDGAAQ